MTTDREAAEVDGRDIDDLDVVSDSADEGGGVVDLTRPEIQDWLIAGIVLGVLVFDVWALTGPWTSRVSLLLLVAPLGLIALAVQCRRGSAAAVAGAGLVVAAFVSALASAAPWPSSLGTADRHMSAVVIAGSVGGWAIARMCTRAVRPLIGYALVGGIALNVIVAVTQVLTGAENAGGLDQLVSGRPPGLLVHPVHLAVGGLAAAVWFARAEFDRTDTGRLLELATVGLGTMAVSLSGTRAATLLVIVAVPAAAWIAGRRGFAAKNLAGLLGVVLGTLTHRLSATGNDSSAVGRIRAGGVGDRLEAWSYALDGWTDEPWLGWGPGRYPIAAQRYIEPEWAAQFGGDGWGSPHNIVVELLVTMGVIGLLVALVFAAFAARSARGQGAWAASVAIVTWSVEPASAGTVLLVLVLAGVSGIASSGQGDNGDDRPEIGRPLVTTALILGLIVGGWHFAGAASIEREARLYAGGDYTWLTWWHSHDPAVANRASWRAFGLADRPERVLNAHRWSERAMDLEPDNGHWVAVYALRKVNLSDFDAARVTARRAIELRPSNRLAWLVLEYVADEEGDETLRREVELALCELDAGSPCDG